MTDAASPDRSDVSRASQLETTTEATQPHRPQGAAAETLVELDLAGSGLHIRCPHCRNQVEFLEEHESSDITCVTCGSIFSIINPSPASRQATHLETVGHFELVARVGIGSFGAVWKAYDPELDRTVAVKIPRRGQLDPVDETQFLREARVAAQLRHPNIVSVHEVGREGDTLYIISDFIEGAPLSEMLSTRRLSLAEILPLGQKIAEALHHAHGRGVVHRDLKPSNIMLDEQGEPHLTDFGLAKRDVGELTMTADGQILGTPAYMSPEQAAGGAHHVDRRTDIYSFGVILFELLTGELPFRGTAQMHIQQKVNEDPPNPQTLDRTAPRDLATICLKCIQREPGRRYATAEALMADLTRFANGEPILARPISRIERSLRWAKRHPAPATLAAFIALLAIAGPPTVWRIDALRREAAELNVQKDRLIKDRDQKIKQSATQIAELDAQRKTLAARLAAWEEGADPATFWPPYEIETPQREMLSQLADDAAYLSTMLEAAENDRQRAQIHLAAAAAAEAANRPRQVIDHLHAARARLEQLFDQAPHDVQTAQALADCLVRIAEAVYADDQATAIESLRQARTVLSQLDGAGDQAKVEAAQFNAELRLAVASGDPEAIRALERLHTQRQTTRPATPAALYELANYLSGRPNLLNP